MTVQVAPTTAVMTMRPAWSVVVTAKLLGVGELMAAQQASFLLSSVLDYWANKPSIISTAAGGEDLGGICGKEQDFPRQRRNTA